MFPEKQAKSRWRRCLRAQRLVHARTGTLPAAQLFTEQARDLQRQLGAGRVAAFVPTRLEPDIFPFLSGQSAVLLPLLFGPDGSALAPGTWAWWSPGDFLERPRRWAPLQPRRARPGELFEVDLVLIPALAVDRSGNRLGQGGGWYDRALQEVAAHAFVAAVVHPWELLAASELPVEAHDRRVDFALTSTGVCPLDG